MILQFVKVETTEQLETLAGLANEIWHEYFPCILTEGQIDYMIERFQSYPAMKAQMEEQGYEYRLFYVSAPESQKGCAAGELAGYTGFCERDGKLFLSKLYLKKEYRGRGLASEAIRFLTKICRERALPAIWLTVNRHNDHTVAVYQHHGFRTVREEATDIGQGYVMDDFIMEKQV